MNRKRAFGVENEFPPFVIRRVNRKKPSKCKKYKPIVRLAEKFLELISKKCKKREENLYGYGVFVPQNQIYAYVDVEHVELATSECSTPRELVAYDKEIERFMAEIISELNKSGRFDDEISASKNNYSFSLVSRTGKYSILATQGTHENYSISKNHNNRNNTMSDWLANRDVLLGSFFATRPIICGNGCIFGKKLTSKDCEYILSQRANFISNFARNEIRASRRPLVLERSIQGLNLAEFGNSRALINTRDEPLANDKKYLRLHVVCGDANMAEWSNYLKFGITSIFLSMLEDGFLNESANQDICIAENIVDYFHKIVRDVSCGEKIVLLRNGKIVSSTEHQRSILNLAKKYFKNNKPSAWEKDVMEKWGYVLERLEANDINALSDKLDWAIKLKYIKMFMKKHNIEGYSDPRVRMLDFQYHELHPERSVFKKLEEKNKVQRIITQSERDAARSQPPFSRALWRKKMTEELNKHKRYFTSNVNGDVSVNWERLSLDFINVYCDDPLPPHLLKLIKRQTELLRMIIKNPDKLYGHDIYNDRLI